MKNDCQFRLIISAVSEIFHMASLKGGDQASAGLSGQRFFVILPGDRA